MVVEVPNAVYNQVRAVRRKERLRVKIVYDNKRGDPGPQEPRRGPCITWLTFREKRWYKNVQYGRYVCVCEMLGETRRVGCFVYQSRRELGKDISFEIRWTSLLLYLQPNLVAQDLHWGSAREHEDDIPTKIKKKQ